MPLHRKPTIRRDLSNATHQPDSKTYLAVDNQPSVVGLVMRRYLLPCVNRLFGLIFHHSYYNQRMLYKDYILYNQHQHTCFMFEPERQAIVNPAVDFFSNQSSLMTTHNQYGDLPQAKATTSGKIARI